MRRRWQFMDDEAPYQYPMPYPPVREPLSPLEYIRHAKAEIKDLEEFLKEKKKDDEKKKKDHLTFWEVFAILTVGALPMSVVLTTVMRVSWVITSNNLQQMFAPH